jgi:hypothetical protein
MFVGTRDDEAIEATALQFGAQGGQSFRWRGRGFETVVARGELGAPGRQCLGEFRVGMRIDQLDPFRAGQTLRRRRDAAHQGFQGSRLRRTAALAQKMENVVGR